MEAVEASIQCSGVPINIIPCGHLHPPVASTTSPLPLLAQSTAVGMVAEAEGNIAMQ